MWVRWDTHLATVLHTPHPNILTLHLVTGPCPNNPNRPMGDLPTCHIWICMIRKRCTDADCWREQRVGQIRNKVFRVSRGRRWSMRTTFSRLDPMCFFSDSDKQYWRDVDDALTVIVFVFCQPEKGILVITVGSKPFWRTTFHKSLVLVRDVYVCYCLCQSNAVSIWLILVPCIKN